MKRAILASVAMSATLALFGAEHTPTYFKMVITDNVGHGGTCQISRFGIFNSIGPEQSDSAGYESLNLTQVAAGTAASALAEKSFSPLIEYGYYDGPISKIFERNNDKWCFDCTDHGGIGNTNNGNDGTVTLVMRLADDAKPVAYNFRSGGDDNTYPGRAFSSWTLYGSTNGVTWDVCSKVKDLAPVSAGNAWYVGTIEGGANNGHFPIAPLTDEPAGTLDFGYGATPLAKVPMVTLDKFGYEASEVQATLECADNAQFTDAESSAAVEVSNLDTPVALSLPNGFAFAPGQTYYVRAKLENDKSFSAYTEPVVVTTGPAASEYAKRATFTVDYDTTDSMNDFRVLVRLAAGSPTGFSYSDCAADGSDIMFASEDGSTPYFFDRDTWSTSGESAFWVRLPSAAKGTKFTMFYGLANAVSQASSEGTWNGYAGVWHFAEANGTAYDATANHLNGTPKAGGNGNVDQMISTNGVIGTARINGIENGGSRNYMSIPSYDNLELGGTFTISGWFHANDVDGYPRLFSRKTSHTSNNGFECEMAGGSKTSLSARGASSTAHTVTFPNIKDGWVHIALVYSGNTLTGYANGARTGGGEITAATDNGLPLSFGCNSNGSEACFNGQYDEIRLIGGAMSAERIAADYATATSKTFISCPGAMPNSPDAPVLGAASVAWLNNATTVSATLSQGKGDIYATFTETPGGTVYRILLAEDVDATSAAQTVSVALTAAQLPLSATYTWFVTAENSDFDIPAIINGTAKYYSGAADPTVRYVAKTGSDDNNGMLLSTAKATLTAAIADLGEDGGTVYIDDGDYAFTSDTDTAVTITTPVKVIGLSRDATKVTITRTGTPKRNFVLDNANCSLEHVTISGGSSGYGMSIALRQGVVADCIICDASWNSWENRGALYAFGGRVTRCIFRNNTGYFGGSALGAEGSAIIENCLFTENNVPNGAEWGGGTVNLGGYAKLINCTIVGNRGTVSSGVKAGGNTAVINCAIYGNTTTSDASGHGHIWWDASAKFSYCAAEGQINDNCYVLAPGFRDSANGDYSLSSASELIDRGMTYRDTSATSATDLIGNDREVDVVDIGCYEYTKNELDVGFISSVQAGLAPMEVTFTATVFGATGTITYEWDFDNDGSVDETTYTDTVTHIYPKGGLYTIALSITTEGGATKQAVLLDEVLVSPKVVYADAANGANAHYPYDTPATATPCLETAIDTAGNGSTVLVADGTYAATNTAGFVVDKAVQILSVSGNPAACVATETAVSGLTQRRVMTINHAAALVSGVTLQGGYLGTEIGATLNFGTLGGMVSNCVIRAGYVRDWGGSAALAHVTPSGAITHSILEDGLARDDYQTKNGRPDTCSIDVEGIVANCLIRNFNQQADNQNIVTVRNGGKLLNCTIVDGLCGNANNEEKTACVGVVAKTGARIENCAIAGFRYREENESFTVRAWNGDANCFTNCATDTAEPINASCITVTTAAFRDYANADYRAAGAASPLVNAGVNNELAEGTDFTCRFRKIGGRMDIGCYEHQANGMAITIR